MIDNRERFLFIPLVNNEMVGFNPPIMPERIEAKNNRLAAMLTSFFSIHGVDVTYSNSAKEAKPSSPDIAGGSKGKTETKTPRKRGRPKGKKTRSHPLLDRPKRPLSGYNFFFRDQREQLYIQGAGRPVSAFRFAELAKTIGARWKALDETSRSIYDALAAVEMKEYRAAMEEYNQKVKKLNDSEKTRSTDADNLKVSNLSSTLKDSGSINGEVHHQADTTTSIEASTSRINDGGMDMRDTHENSCTNQAQETQSLSQVAEIVFNHLPPSPISSSSTKKQLDEVYSTNVSFEPQQISPCHLTTDACGSDKSEISFDFIDDMLGFDKDENSVPDASFLVSNTQF
mmetsp:Transcript_11682/g.16502  ORF Transcript_11682/g.16502 Transcript_11682/m.16502 type:complete len:343 (+) Transcript_11682:175-1203(+)